MTYSWLPSTGDVALLVAQRVLDMTGSGLTDFATDTAPTSTQVTALIVFVANQVASKAGDIPSTPVDLGPLARNVSAIGTAAWVELSFYADDLRGHADALMAAYESALAELVEAADAVRSSGAIGPGGDQPLPVFGFPSQNFDPRVPITSWTTGF